MIGEPAVWDWTDWNEADPGVQFSQRKIRVGGDGPPVAITAPVVELFGNPSVRAARRLVHPLRQQDRQFLRLGGQATIDLRER